MSRVTTLSAQLDSPFARYSIRLASLVAFQGAWNFAIVQYAVAVLELF
jgi:hypothetical protein